MELITFIANKGEIHSRGINDAPEAKIRKTDNFESGCFYLGHNNGMDYIKLNQDELMVFIKLVYCLDTFDMNEESILNIINLNTGIYYAGIINGVNELREFFYNGVFVKDVESLIDLYNSGAFHYGFNINQLKLK